VRIAFYAPLKAPTHGTPSGDRRVAALYVEALRLAGHGVDLISDFRSYDGEGDPERQRALRSEGIATARELASRLLGADASVRPELWFTYHVYHKAPDWLGPEISRALGIPYVIAEASHAPKRAHGAWSLGHHAAAEAIRAASLVISPTRFDLACLQTLIGADRLLLLPPFLEPEPFAAAAAQRASHRARLAVEQGLDPEVPWISVAAMMRPGDKMASYEALASVLQKILDLRWHLVVAGAGPSEREVARILHAAAPGRCRMLGALSLAQVAAMYAACDLSIWPACNEAYGMAMLEAQAAGVPVVSVADRGVPDVVVDGRTGLLAPRLEAAMLADLARALLVDPARRAAMGQAAMQYVAEERSLQSAAHALQLALQQVRASARTA